MLPPAGLRGLTDWLTGKEMHVETSRDIRYQKAFYFVDKLRENVLGNVYSLDLNYDMELYKDEFIRENWG